MTTGTPHPRITENLNILLSIEVDGMCPDCGIPLIYEKNKTHQKVFDIAHIYPLNPTVEEGELLRGVERMAEDSNSPLNLIPLCKVCHRKFDRPRTANDYNRMREIKLRAVRLSKERSSWKDYELRSEINRIIRTFTQDSNATQDIDLSYDPKRIDEKLAGDVPAFIKRDVHRNVQDYFGVIRHLLLEIEREHSGAAEIIYLQVKMYYLKQMGEGYSKVEIIENITNWIRAKTKSDHLLPCSILTSYFIQNCEVF